MSLKIYLILGVLALGMLSGVAWKIREDGVAAGKATYEKAQKKQNKKVEKNDAKIDKETPFDAERATQLEWLRERAVRQ